MLKGKALDMKGDYRKAVDVFENNFKEFVNKNKESLENEKIAKEIGDLEFRYGWSLIRSKKDIE